ncbi:hypothetical protein pEaSNUABM30_00053 [Erwinia phage pEa_SNUABM_30]|uniref:Uncharacterized protein n=1 Tax=Erwinia phage pEa_SNUABM_30 TaxID=2869553 RepID=A0AAE8XLU3_9CAUD|nr:hypothetical protein MPK69_gp053 [Erwinia phage pEa_SNUABM_30]UAW53171.1 hypothetical protein pEaSNUABM30_00053 [Erwinia phage pEa_SNUABM_30]
MLKRLFAFLFRKKKKTFEEKLTVLAEGRAADPETTRRLDDALRRRPSGSPGYQPDPFGHKVAPPPKKRYQTTPTPMPERKNFNGQPRRGMTVNQASSNRAQTDDLILAVMMQQTYVAPTPIRSHDDSCRVDHTPSYRHSDPDPSPSCDGGSDSGYSGGSGCD